MLLPDKVAVKEIEKASIQGFSNTFILYYIFSAPLMEIGASARAAIVFINLMLSYSLALCLYNLALFDKHKSKKAQYCYLLILFYPDLFYFGLFSLRDIGIGVFAAFILIGLYMKNYKIIMIFSLALFFTRPEMIIWIMALFGLFFISKFRHNYAFLFTFVFFIAGIILATPNFILWYLKFNNWSVETLDVSYAINFLLENRYERQFSDTDGSGSTSPTLPEHIFYNLNLLSRTILQGFSLIYLTLAPSSNIIILAIFTGIYPIYLMTKLLFKKFRLKFLMLSMSLFSFMIYSPFMVNGGNAFRLRTTFIILIFTTLAIWVRENNKPLKELIKNA